MVLDQHLVWPRSQINTECMFASLIDSRTNKSVWDTVRIIKPLMFDYANRLARDDPRFVRLRKSCLVITDGIDDLL